MKSVFHYKGHKVEIERYPEPENRIEVAIDDKNLTGAFRVSGLSPVKFAHLMIDGWRSLPKVGRIDVFLTAPASTAYLERASLTVARV